MIVKDKYIPDYCIATGNIHTQNWNEDIINESSDTKFQIYSITSMYIEKISLNDFIFKNGLTYI